MSDNRDDFIIAIRYALLKKGAKQKFSLFFLILLSISIIILDKFSLPFMSPVRSVLNDIVYHVSVVSSQPLKLRKYLADKVEKHYDLVSENNSNIEIIEAISCIELENLIENREKVGLVVKIDVEGSEMNVITELLKTQLANEINEIYFEVNERWVDYNDIEILLKSNGYKFFSKTSADTRHYDVYARKQ